MNLLRRMHISCRCCPRSGACEQPLTVLHVAATLRPKEAGGSISTPPTVILWGVTFYEGEKALTVHTIVWGAEEKPPTKVVSLVGKSASDLNALAGVPRWVPPSPPASPPVSDDEVSPLPPPLPPTPPPRICIRMRDPEYTHDVACRWV